MESTSNTKISDSGYSNSCSNTNSQRSASSKSRHSASSASRSSGYCGTTSNADASTGSPSKKRNKEKDHKNDKSKPTTSNYSNTDGSTAVTLVVPGGEIKPSSGSEEVLTKQQNMGIEGVTPSSVDTPVPDMEINPSELIPCPDLMVATEESQPLNEPTNVLPCKDDSENQTLKVEKEHEKVVVVEANNTSNNHKTTNNQHEEGFCCVISMYDGVVLYTSPSLTTALGFPKDMWLGRSFIDFVHPKDRDTFSAQVTTGVASPFINSHGELKDVKNCLHVCLRKYRGLRSSGFGVVEKAVSYQAFRLTVSIKYIADAPGAKYDNNNGLFLVVVAIPVRSAYKVPEERKKLPKFGMRHTAACIFSHVDPDVVTNFGFLPQDMLGKSVFDFYHPEDMPFVKEIYESVMQMCQITGTVFRSKPYRFAVQNGGFAVIETEWSSFVNPWSRRLEFVIGLHRVLQGPIRPDVFDTNKDDVCKHVSKEVIKQSKIIEGEIMLLLNQELPRPSGAAKHEVSKRCKDLANFMESLMNDVDTSKLQLDPTISERDFVMLGEISPHHEYYDSKSSSETSPSYNQLNYNENIKRFFQSKPKTTVSDESNPQNNVFADQEAKTESPDTKCLSPVQNSGTSGSGSAGNLSSLSNPNLESGTTSTATTNTNSDLYKPPQLTESLLNKHNENMEKILIKRHRDHKHSSKDQDGKKGHRKLDKNIMEKIANDKNEYIHGVKRSGSNSWEGDYHKISKHKHQSTVNNPGDALTFKKPTTLTNTADQSMTNNLAPNVNIFPTGLSDVHLWPPFPLSVTAPNNSQACNANINGNPAFNPAMFPFYYVPTATPSTFPPSYIDPVFDTSRYQVQYIPSMLYNSIFPASPVMCPSLPILPVSMASPLCRPDLNNAKPNEPKTVSKNYNRQVSAASTVVVPQLQRPASCATSVKAEPGSALGSIASASVLTKAFSESSRKDMGLQSVCSPDSPVVTLPDADTEADRFSMSGKAFSECSRKDLELQSVGSVASPVVSLPDEETEAEHFTMSVKLQHQKHLDQEKNETESFGNNIDEGSSYSSSYSSFLKTDTGSGSNDEFQSNMKGNQSDGNSDTAPKYYPQRKKDPPWVESTTVSSDLVYRYQVAVKNLEEILEDDLNSLKKLNQPNMVNEQLHQLYIEMELQGLSTQLTLDEESSSCSEDENVANTSKAKRKRRSYSSLVMIYEEDAPFPSPDD